MKQVIYFVSENSFSCTNHNVCWVFSLTGASLCMIICNKTFESSYGLDFWLNILSVFTVMHDEITLWIARRVLTLVRRRRKRPQPTPKASMLSHVTGHADKWIGMDIVGPGKKYYCKHTRQDSRRRFATTKLFKEYGGLQACSKGGHAPQLGKISKF